MCNAFSDVSVSGIIKPGNVYIFTEYQDREWKTDPVEYLYAITKEEEILQALEMNFYTVLAETYELKKFLGWKRVGKDCHQFKMLCYDKGGQAINKIFAVSPKNYVI